MMFDRLFGKPSQTTDITTGGEKINTVPKIVFVDDDFEEEKESDDIVNE